MVLILKLTFWVSLGLLVHSYVLYPVILWILSKGKSLRQTQTPNESHRLSVIMSVYNEEKIIAEKIDSLLNSDFPQERMTIFIGSDNSSDGSNKIIASLAEKHNNIRFTAFKERQGKIGVINKLAEEVFAHSPKGKDHILLYTDANVILEKSTVSNLMRHFEDEKIAVVDANMLNTKLNSKGISKAERTYLDYEIMMKHREGLIWGKMIGSFGGCYCLRSSFHTLVPDNFIVDDFFITFSSLVNGGQAINDLEAKCYESASDEMGEEYRRKRRISSGNFQNLFHFKSHLFKINSLSFAFWSHKVLRWIGPFLMILIFISSLILAFYNQWFYGWIAKSALLGIALIFIFDWVLTKLHINIMLLRKIKYFIIMNLALLEGFFNYAKGIKSSIWQPPKRV